MAADDELIFGFESVERLALTWGDKVDGRLELSTGRAFVTQGKACLRLVGDVAADAKGNSYLGVRIPLAKPTDLRSQLLCFDAATSTPAHTRALYLRAYDARGRRAASFVNWRGPLSTAPRTIRLLAEASMYGFIWEPRMVTEGADLSAVTAIELIIGTPDRGVTIDAYFDNLRLGGTKLKAWAAVDKPKALVPETTIVAAGKPAAVLVTPAGKQWDRATQALRRAIKEVAGVVLPVKRVGTVPELLKDNKLPVGDPARRDLAPWLWGASPPAVEDKPATAVILGNVADTAALLYLYSHYYTPADHFYPGPGGYDVRTVHDPWGVGLNALVVGCSDPEGALLAVDALRPVLAKHFDQGTLRLPRLRMVKLAGEADKRYGRLLSSKPADSYLEGQKKAAERDLARGAHTGLFSRIASVGHNYILSADSAYARAFVWLVQRAYEHYKTKPTTYGGPWGMDSDFTVYRVIPAWDVVEEDPAITDEERWEVTQILRKWVEEVAVRPASSVVGRSYPRHNHQTFPALGLLYAADYFDKYYHIAQAQHWLAIADECFRLQAKFFKAHEDCNGYQWLTLSHLAQYCLARPDFSYFTPSPLWPDEPDKVGARARWGRVSNARRDADYAIIGTDSFGYATTYGDTGYYVGWWTELNFLRMVNFVLRDERIQWAIQRKYARSGRLDWGQYAVNMPARVPSELLGAVAFPLDPAWWKRHRGDDPTPLAAAVDKVTLRDGFEDESTYLLLDGLNPGGHRHLDANSISRWCAGGRIWLADADYFRAEPQAHSTAIVLRNGLASAMPLLCGLGHLADLPHFAAVETVMQRYNGADWHRWLMWPKGGPLLVADRFVAQEAGDYSIRIYWQLLGDAAVEGAAVDVVQDGVWARLAFPADARLVVTDDEDYGKNWAPYPHIRRRVVRVLRAVYDVRLEKGEEFVAWTLLHCAGAKPSRASLVRSGLRGVVIRGLAQDAPVGAGLGSAPPVGPRRVAAAWMLTPRALAVVDQEGRDLEAELATGQATVISPSVTVPDGAANVAQARETELRVSRDAVVKAVGKIAAGAAKPAAPLSPVPTSRPQWTHWLVPDSAVVTGNPDKSLPVVDLLAGVWCDPAPRAVNIFRPEPGRNRPANLFDGRLTGTGDCVMWDADVSVTLTVALRREVGLDRIDLRAWWASSSSKGAKFQIAAIDVELSSDGFRKDVRRAGGLRDEKEHENWGGKAHLPERYVIELGGQKARQVRLRVAPRPGTAVYLAELYLWARRLALADDAELASRAVSMPHLTSMCFDGGTGALLAGGSDGRVWLLGADGQVVWTAEAGAPILSTAVVRFDGKTPVYVVGCEGGSVVAYSRQGSKLWAVELERYKRTPNVRVALAADFSGKGRETLVVGADNWRYYAIDGKGQVLWHYESVHIATAAHAVDLTGDGVDEVVLGTNYYWWHAVKADGKALWRYSTRTGPECTAIAAGDIDGDGAAEVVFAAGDGGLQCVSNDGKPRWTVYLGERATAMQCADLDGNGKAELLVASANGLAYCLGEDGKPRWYTSLGGPVLSAALVGSSWVCGTWDGSVVWLDVRTGQPVAKAVLVGPASVIAAGDDAAFAATELGQLACLRAGDGR